jgi:uncharacterized protein (DUF362 family)
MITWTRRQFLRWAAATLAVAGTGLLGSGCASQTGTSPGEGRRPAPTPTGDEAYLTVARGSDPAATTERALAALGGIARFVRQGDDVIIKPNICVDYYPPEYAATTNPTVVATLVTLCQEAGARRVRVMDMPFGGTPASAYSVSGIEAAVQAAGGEMEVMNRAKFVKTDLPQGEDIEAWDIYGDVMTADVLINVPIAKHHSLARLSLGMKNLLGVIQRPNMVHVNLGQRVADLASGIRPTLTVVDAMRILVDHGPTGGSLNDVEPAETIIASHDIVAADAWTTSLFGMAPTDISYIRAAAQMGLGTTDFDTINVKEV